MASELKLIIKADYIPANELAKIITDLDASFKAFYRRRESNPQGIELAVSSVRRGSIEIIFEAVDAIKKIIEARDYLAPFATHLAQAFGWISGIQYEGSSRKPTAADRKAFGSLAAPVANGSAQQINLVNNGNIYINIDGVETAKNVIETLQKPKIEMVEDQDSPARQASITKKQLTALEHGELQGHAFRVDGAWYARLLGGAGVLVPISASDYCNTRLIEGELYSFRGNPLRGNRGEIVGIYINDLRPL